MSKPLYIGLYGRGEQSVSDRVAQLLAPQEVPGDAPADREMTFKAANTFGVGARVLVMTPSGHGYHAVDLRKESA
jgi:hypothetical protein